MPEKDNPVNQEPSFGQSALNLIRRIIIGPQISHSQELTRRVDSAEILQLAYQLFEKVHVDLKRDGFVHVRSHPHITTVNVIDALAVFRHADEHYVANLKFSQDKKDDEIGRSELGLKMIDINERLEDYLTYKRRVLSIGKERLSDGRFWYVDYYQKLNIPRPLDLEDNERFHFGMGRVGGAGSVPHGEELSDQEQVQFLESMLASEIDDEKTQILFSERPQSSFGGTPDKGTVWLGWWRDLEDNPILGFHLPSPRDP